jgi:dihydroxy-acid dehydratase
MPGAWRLWGDVYVQHHGLHFRSHGIDSSLQLFHSGSRPLKQRECEQVGPAIKVLLEADIRPLQLLTKSAFVNGIVTAAAIGGSTNVVLHLLAIAREAGVDLKIEEFQEIFRRTPVIANFAPRGPKSMVDLHRVGGTPALLKVLLAEGLIDGDILTVTGKTLRENLQSLPELSPGQDVVAVGGKFFKDSADLQIVFGTLAPDSAVFKVPFDQTRWTGPARVFNGEADMVNAVAQGDIKPGDIVIIRYVGPKGAPGMPEMLEPSSAISSVPELNGQVVLITDARYSGVSGGAIGGHVCPEAYEPGSPISLVENGDPIVLDLQAGFSTWTSRRTFWRNGNSRSSLRRIHGHCRKFSVPIGEALVRLDSVVRSENATKVAPGTEAVALRGLER